MDKWFKLCSSDPCSVSDWLNARGYPCTKGYNSSASQWLSEEEVRLCFGHPKVHFRTIVEGFLGLGEVGGGGVVHSGSFRIPDYMGNLELVQSFCSRVAVSSWVVHDGWLSKGDDCDEVMSVWWIWIVWSFAVLVCSVNINYEKNLTAALATIFVCLSELLYLCVFVSQTVQWLTVTLLAEYPKQPIQTPLMTKAGGDSLCLRLKVMGRAF